MEDKKTVKDFLGQEITPGSFIYYFKSRGKSKFPLFAYVERLTENNSVMARQIYPRNDPNTTRVGNPSEALIINDRTMEHLSLKKLGSA